MGYGGVMATQSTASAAATEARPAAPGRLSHIAVDGAASPAFDDLGLPAALALLTDRLSAQTGAAINRRIDRRLPELSPQVELVFYRIAQEALTNALRQEANLEIEERSGGGTEVTLRLPSTV